jgi:hypothetical protein
MAVANEGLEKLEDMIVRQAEATGAQVSDRQRDLRDGHALLIPLSAARETGVSAGIMAGPANHARTEKFGPP